MASINTITVETSTDILNPEKNNSKSHAMKRRSSIFNRIGSGSTTTTNSTLRMRRQSTRYSIPRGGFERRFIRYENTYRMQPDGNHKVDFIQLHRIANHIVETAIFGYKYDPNRVKKFSSNILDRTRHEIKQLAFSRYKTVAQVIVGQKKGLNLFVASRCLWNSQLDRHITISKQTGKAFITLIIFFVYTD